MYEDSKIELTIEYLSFDSDTKLDLNSRLELENFRPFIDNVVKTKVQLQEPFTFTPVSLKATVSQYTEYDVFIPVEQMDRPV